MQRLTETAYGVRFSVYANAKQHQISVSKGENLETGVMRANKTIVLMKNEKKIKIKSICRSEPPHESIQIEKIGPSKELLVIELVCLAQREHQLDH